MRMKKFLLSCALLVAALAAVVAEETAVSVILNNFGAGSYAQGAIPGADLDRIVSAGVRAPSSGNRQPWRFTVVRDPLLVKKIMGSAPEGNVFIIVSADSSSRDAVFDCALAAENIYLAAQALGYGSRIYASPLNTVNGSLKPELGIEPPFSAVAVVRVGRLAPNVDAVSSASPRKPARDTVTYK
jgi:nitroreductase